MGNSNANLQTPAATAWRPGRLRIRFLPAATGKDDRRMSHEKILHRHGNRYR